MKDEGENRGFSPHFFRGEEDERRRGEQGDVAVSFKKTSVAEVENNKIPQKWLRWRWIVKTFGD